MNFSDAVYWIYNNIGYRTNDILMVINYNNVTI